MPYLELTLARFSKFNNNNYTYIEERFFCGGGEGNHKHNIHSKKDLDFWKKLEIFDRKFG